MLKLYHPPGKKHSLALQKALIFCRMPSLQKVERAFYAVERQFRKGKAALCPKAKRRPQRGAFDNSEGKKSASVSFVKRLYEHRRKQDGNHNGKRRVYSGGNKLGAA